MKPMFSVVAAIATAIGFACPPATLAQSSITSLSQQSDALMRWNEMPPRDLFLSDEVLEASLREIATLNLRVAEALARALADCTDSLSEDEGLRAYCDRAYAYFDIVSAPRGALGLLSAAVNGNRLLIRLTSKGHGTSTENAARIDRMVKIEGRWKNAVRWRLQELDKVPR